MPRCHEGHVSETNQGGVHARGHGRNPQGQRRRQAFVGLAVAHDPKTPVDHYRCNIVVAANGDQCAKVAPCQHIGRVRRDRLSVEWSEQLV